MNDRALRSLTIGLGGPANGFPRESGFDIVPASEELGYGKLPVCIAKTQYSFSTEPEAVGLADGHSLKVREVRLSAGAGFVVVICGDIMTMPGLPKEPSAIGMDLDPDGQVVGLS